MCDLLASVHGLPTRPKVLVDKEDAPAGCGQVPSVLDALVRCVEAFVLSPRASVWADELSICFTQDDSLPEHDEQEQHGCQGGLGAGHKRVFFSS